MPRSSARRFCARTQPDYDPTPATTTVKVDTTVPNTFITRTPQDDIRPDWPVTLTRSPQVVLNSNEGGAGFACTVNDRPRACAEGQVTLRHLKSGPQDFTARAVDAAGNADPTPSSTKFFVPLNIKASRGSGWQRVRKADAFDGDLVRASKVGATLRIGGQRNVREVRLIAPAGPQLGRVQVRVGRSQWYTVNLSGKAAAPEDVRRAQPVHAPAERRDRDQGPVPAARWVGPARRPGGAQVAPHDLEPEPVVVSAHPCRRPWAVRPSR